MTELDLLTLLALSSAVSIRDVLESVRFLEAGKEIDIFLYVRRIT
jgi:hypothetical protein